MPVILIGNHKGGVGKTTITAGLAAQLAATGRQVIAVDLDPQANLTRRLGYDDEVAAELAGRPNASTVIAAADPDLFAASLVPCQWEPDWAEKVSLCPGHPDLDTRASEAGEIGSWRRLRKALAGVDPDTIVLIDTPPSMGHLFAMALCAATHVLAVTEPELDAVQGVAKLEAYIGTNADDLQLRCQLGGVIINSVRRSYVHTARTEQLQEAFGDRLWEPSLRQCAPVLDNMERSQPPQLGHAATTKVFDAYARRTLAMLETSPVGVGA